MSEAQPKAAATREDANLIDLLLVFAENIRLLLYGPLIAGVLVFGSLLLFPSLFTATTRILPPQHPQGATALLGSQFGALAGVAGLAGISVKNPTDMYIGLITSRTIADRLIERFDLMKLYDNEFRVDTRKVLARRTSIAAGKDGLIAIEVDDEDPDRAAQIANAYVEELVRLNSALAITEAQQRRAFFEYQLAKVHESLKAAQQALGEAGVPESLIKSSPDVVVEGVARLKAQVTAQVIKLSTMRAYLTEQSPEFRLARSELESLRAQLAQVERNQPAGNLQQAEYLSRYRDFKYQETLFELMAKQYEVARLDEAREGALVQIVDVAVAPERSSKPRRLVISILSVVVSAIGLFLYVLVRDSLRFAKNEPDAAAKIGRVSSGFRRLLGR